MNAKILRYGIAGVAVGLLTATAQVHAFASSFTHSADIELRDTVSTPPGSDLSLSLELDALLESDLQFAIGTRQSSRVEDRYSPAEVEQTLRSTSVNEYSFGEYAIEASDDQTFSVLATPAYSVPGINIRGVQASVGDNGGDTNILEGSVPIYSDGLGDQKMLRVDVGAIEVTERVFENKDNSNYSAAFNLELMNE